MVSGLAPSLWSLGSTRATDTKEVIIHDKCVESLTVDRNRNFLYEQKEIKFLNAER